MKLKLLATNGTPYFVIKYEDGEWDMLEQKYKELGLEPANTAQGCGVNVAYEYYRDPKNMFSTSLSRSVGGIRNDINSAFYAGNAFNIAMLRVIPNSRGEVKIPLASYPTIQDIRSIANALSSVLKATLETMCAMEISLVIRKQEEAEEAE